MNKLHQWGAWYRVGPENFARRCARQGCGVVQESGLAANPLTSEPMACAGDAPKPRLEITFTEHYGADTTTVSARVPDLNVTVSAELLAHPEHAKSYLFSKFMTLFENELAEVLFPSQAGPSEDNLAPIFGAPDWSDPASHQYAAFVAATESVKKTESPVDKVGLSVKAVLREAFPKAMDLQAACPLTSKCRMYDDPCYTVATLVPHLNDYHRWTAAQIAEWLENTFDPEEIAS